ncbi:hypothetical protein LCGC14_1948850 [marine sediment metagenome]|uniref:Fido domain-containing protein n=1 Tax=marine sediment metagenome TaxID=412755 RepID=A0A0F9HWE2_9ZZZZ
MVNLRKKKVSGKEYYYLSYSYRENTEVKNISKAIGKEVPENLEEIKDEFYYEIFQKLWLSTIEKITKKYHKQFDSLPKQMQLKGLRIFGVRFTHNTNKIEGSTLTLHDVSLIIEDNITPSIKPANDIIEAKSHMSVYEEMITSNREIDWELVLDWHEKIFELTKPEIAGITRQYPVQISRSNYIPPMEGVENLIDELLEWYKENKDKLHPVYLACMMHFRFVSIHPFGDGNGRMCRILMNYILFKAKYPMFDIEYRIRQSYYNALENANLKKDDMFFIGWFCKRYIKANEIYL